MSRYPIAVVVAVIALSLVAPAGRAAEVTPAGDFQTVWARTDRPVADLGVGRTWIWGPMPFTRQFSEPYAESPNGERTVQYFDKSRMEMTQPYADPITVTMGLLARDLVTGLLQVGDAAFEVREPAEINVAGDLDDPLGPTYATFTGLLGAPPLADGAPVDWQVDRIGNVVADPSLAARGVTAAHHVVVPGIDHQIASVFWEFMMSSGPVEQDGTLVEGPLFPDPFEVVGYPLTEPYWATVRVGGTPHEVLVQVFERRVLTYTAENLDGWKVEAGNVGQHYYLWRYGTLPLWQKLAFTSTRDGNSEIYTVDASGEGLTRLTNTPENEDVPSWSPDHTKIAFDLETIGGAGKDIYKDIYVMNADGSGLTRISSGLANSHLVGWSPDGQSVAFSTDSSNIDATLWDLWVARADGSGATRILEDPMQMAAVSWSPDGSRLAFSGNHCDPAQPTACENLWHIFTVATDGSGMQQISELDARSPTWSPDGSRIAFTGRTCAEDDPATCSRTRQVFTVNTDGSDLVSLGDGATPAWSPDGSRIAFIQYDWDAGYSSTRIVVAETGGGNESTIATLANITTLAWSPDGARIAMVALPYGPYQIFLVNADGSGLTPLAATTSERFEVGPAWSLDGNFLKFETLEGNDTNVYVASADGLWERNVSLSGADGNAGW